MVANNLKWKTTIYQNKYQFLGKTTVMFFKENTITFIDIATQSEVCFVTPSQKAITAIAGHRIYSLFAYAELSFNPSITVALYPSFNVVQTLTGGEENFKYMDLLFNESDHLVGLTGYPNYSLNVWDFRKNRLLATEQTGLISNEQHIKFGPSNFVILLQYAPKPKHLNIWEIHCCSDKSFIFKKYSERVRFLSPNAFNNHVLGFDNTLYLVDYIGNVLGMSLNNPGVFRNVWMSPTKEMERKKSSTISPPPNLKTTTSICNFRGGLAIKQANNVVTFIKKVQLEWNVQWQFLPDSPVDELFCNDTDELFITGKEALYMMKEVPGEPRFIAPFSKTYDFVKFFDVINPYTDYIAIVNKTNELVVKRDQETVSTFEGVSSVTCMFSHPIMPLICLGDEIGMVYFISYLDIKEPKVTIKCRPGKDSITQISIREDFVVVNDTANRIFIGSWELDEKGQFQFQFLHTFVTDPIYPILRSIQYKIGSTLRIIALLKENPSSQYGNLFKIYTYDADAQTLGEEKYESDLNYIMIGLDLTNKILGLEESGVEFHILEVQEDQLKIVKKIETSPIKKFTFFIQENYFISWNCCGEVVIFDSTQSKQILTATFCKNSEKFNFKCIRIIKNQMVFLTTTGKMLCYEFVNIPERAKKDLVDHMLLKCKISMNEDKAWIDKKRETQLEQEASSSVETRNRISTIFQEVQREIVTLIEKNNDILLPHHRVEMKIINLSKEWGGTVFDNCRKLRDMELKTIHAFIAEQNKIKTFVINLTWNMMKSQNNKIFGIFSDIFVENYSIPKPAPDSKTLPLKQVEFLRNRENVSKALDNFYPWIVEGPRKSDTIEEVVRVDENQEDEELDDEALQLKEQKAAQDRKAKEEFDYIKSYLLSGAKTYAFIKPIRNRFIQLEMKTFYQLNLEEVMAQYDIEKLKEFFNATYSKFKDFKRDQVGILSKQNDRLRHIQKELIILAQLADTVEETANEVIIDVESFPHETPEKIIEVANFEVKAKPYISPEEQKRLDEIAYQEELKRLAMLADDFRERALMTMMDGVLEKLWEDEIKKDPPKPAVLLSDKDPYNYTKEDIEAINAYDKAVAFIEGERLKYQGMLREEKVITKQKQDDLIWKFNLRCTRTQWLKQQSDMAVKEEELKMLLNKLNGFKRMKIAEKMEKLSANLAESKSHTHQFFTRLEAIEKFSKDVRLKYEQVQNKDRLLDKQFKQVYGETAPNFILDQAYKIFKRRPKWQARAWMTSNIFNELASKISSRSISKDGIPLREECTEFLVLLDALDSYSLSPNAIDQKCWDLLCKMRRNKIETEFRVKAIGMQIAEIDFILSSHSKEFQYQKSLCEEIEKSIFAQNEKILGIMQNPYTQIVIPCGQNEVFMSGKLEDCKNAIFLNIMDVDDINFIIKKAGTKKLTAMRKMAKFRRNVFFKEWEHKVLRLSVRDMKDIQHNIEKCKVTKEVLFQLRQKHNNRYADTSVQALNKTIDGKMTYLQNALIEINMEIEAIKTKIEQQKEDNTKIDKVIEKLNVEVSYKNFNRDHLLEERAERVLKERINALLYRAKMIRRVQSNHYNIGELITLLEIQKLKTFPTLFAAKPPC